jgi:hypothetical protein
VLNGVERSSVGVAGSLPPIEEGPDGDDDHQDRAEDDAEGHGHRAVTVEYDKS